MGILNSLKKLVTPQQEEKTEENIYEGIGISEPFTALDNEQMRSFISKLVDSRGLHESEKKAFESLWYAICPDIDGFGNNIWNLRKGSFTIYEEDGIKAGYEKRTSEGIDDEGSFRFKKRKQTIKI